MLGHQSDYLVIRLPDNENLKIEWFKRAEKLIIQFIDQYTLQNIKKPIQILNYFMLFR